MAPVDPNVLRLVQVTLRTFYDAKYVIVADQLLRKEASVMLLASRQCSCWMEHLC
jgi:hypothetical protein